MICPLCPGGSTGLDIIIGTLVRNTEALGAPRLYDVANWTFLREQYDVGLQPPSYLLARYNIEVSF